MRASAGCLGAALTAAAHDISVSAGPQVREMKVSVDDLKVLPQRRLDLDFNEKLEGLEAVKPVVGEIVLQYSASGVRLNGRVKTLLKLQCDRCLRPYFQALAVNLEEGFVSEHYSNSIVDNSDRELRQSDFVEPIPANGVLDISDVVYQAVTLATPAFKDCGSECPGPPGAAEPSEEGAAVESGGKGVKSGGGSKNAAQAEDKIDPRWKNLKTLFPKEDSQQNS